MDNAYRKLIRAHVDNSELPVRRFWLVVQDGLDLFGRDVDRRLGWRARLRKRAGLKNSEQDCQKTKICSSHSVPPFQLDQLRHLPATKTMDDGILEYNY